MKILYVITSTDVGGAEKSLVELVAYTAKEHAVKVICLKPLGPVADELRAAGAEVQSLQMTWYSQTRIIQKLAREVTAFAPDIVHALLYRAIEYTRIACAGKGIKLITSPHFDLSKKSFALRWTDRLLKDLDTLTVAESFSTASYLVEHQKYQKNKVFLLPNGADEKRFFRDDSVRAAMRQKHGFTAQNTVFIQVARLAPVKDPLTSLQAFRNVLRSFPSARLVYVGEGIERPRLEQYITQNGMEQTVLLAGEQTDINAWLNMADAFVLSSVEESLPLSLLEALRVGLPCVVSQAGDMPLWVEHGKNGFVFKPGDLTLLSCLMAELASSPEQRERMGEISLEIAQRMTHTSQQYQHIYQQVKTNSFHVKTLD